MKNFFILLFIILQNTNAQNGTISDQDPLNPLSPPKIPDYLTKGDGDIDSKNPETLDTPFSQSPFGSDRDIFLHERQTDTKEHDTHNKSALVKESSIYFNDTSLTQNSDDTTSDENSRDDYSLAQGNHEDLNETGHFVDAEDDSLTQNYTFAGPLTNAPSPLSDQKKTTPFEKDPHSVNFDSMQKSKKNCLIIKEKIDLLCEITKEFISNISDSIDKANSLLQNAPYEKQKEIISKIYNEIDTHTQKNFNIKEYDLNYLKELHQHFIHLYSTIKKSSQDVLTFARNFIKKLKPLNKEPLIKEIRKNLKNIVTDFIKETDSISLDKPLPDQN